MVLQLKLKYFLVLLALSLQYGLTPSNAMELEQPRPISNTLGVFKLESKHQCKRYPGIYFKYTSNIDVENVLKLPGKDFGFKIFRTQEKDEIGYIIPNYILNTGDVRIGSIWINENMRRNGYATKAIQTLIALWVAKKRSVQRRYTPST